MTSGRKSPGAPSRMSVPTITAIVPTTSSPVMISFRRNCILASFQNGTFGTSAQELSDHRILRLLELFRRGVFNDFSLIQHSHSRADAEGVPHFVGNDNGGNLRFFRKVD